MPGKLLDNPGFVGAREKFWTAALTDERYAKNRIAIAEHDGSVFGIAMNSPPQEADGSAAAQLYVLYVLYVLAAHQGTGAGTSTVIDPDETAILWVADPNPRAQAFYRKRGFTTDGISKVEDGVREIRMARGKPT